MATAEQHPSPALLRLRPADVVRLCGLNAAAAGLELADSHRVIASRREGSRLFASIEAERRWNVWVEIPDELDEAQWECDCTNSGPLACAHVAAALSAWISHPSDFSAKATDVEAPHDATPPGAHPQRILPHDDAPAREPPTQRPASSPTTLAATLARMSGADVSTLGRRICGVEPDDDAASTRQKILATLSNPADLQTLLGRLDSSARILLILVDLAGGAMTAADLEALAGRIDQSMSAVQGDVGVLERHALLLPMLPSSVPSEHGRGASWRHVAGWRIPDEVRQAFSAPLPLEALPATGSGRSAAPIEPSGAPLHMMRSAPRTLCLALALLTEAPPPLGLPRVSPPPNDSAMPARQSSGLLAPGEPAPERLKELARGAGLDVAAVRLARRLLRQAREQQPAPPIGDLARMPPMERPVVLRAAFRHWLRADSAADLVDVESPGSGLRLRYAKAHPGFRPAAIASDVSDGRRFVARLLSRAQPETWYSLESFVALVWQVRPGLLRGQQQSWATPAWWLESVKDRWALQPHVRDDWMAGEGAFIRSLIAGAFSAWGAVDLAMSESGAPVAFRVTPFGFFLLQQRENRPVDAALVALCDADWGPPVLPLREGTLAVQPLSAGASLLDTLALWATPTAVSGKRLVYTFSADRACAAFDQHLAPDALPALLRPLHDRAAEHATNQLERWHAAWGQTRLTTGFTLLEASDEATLLEVLAAAPEIAGRCRRIGPALALALPEDAAILRTLLAKRGYAV